MATEKAAVKVYLSVTRGGVAKRRSRLVIEITDSIRTLLKGLYRKNERGYRMKPENLRR